MTDLPAGFQLDQPASPVGLPAGFELDAQGAASPVGGNTPPASFGSVAKQVLAGAGSSALDLVGMAANPVGYAVARLTHTPTLPDVAKKTLGKIGLNPEDYPAQNAPERIARFTGEMLPGALIPGGGSLPRQLATMTGAGLVGGAVGETVPEAYRPYAQLAGGLLAGTGISRLGRPPAVPAAASLPGMSPFGVDLSAGQESGQLPLIQTEQAAARNQFGPRAQAVADNFRDQQAGQLAAARENITSGLDPFNQTIAENPFEAGQTVSDALQKTAAQRKAGVTSAYDLAQNLPGEIHAGVFEGIGQRIKGDLSLRDNPVVIDDNLTPFASQAIKDVDDRVSNLIVQNRADPFAPSSAENIVGINLKGVDQMRKRLSSFRNDAYASGNAADGRAAKAVLDAFDDQVDQAVNGGAFTGDPRAIQAWNDARAAYADYRKTFTAGKNDPVGRVVEKILGKGPNPAANPNDVADFMYGRTAVNPSSIDVNVTNRIKGILGEQSPEWSAVRQGLFNRLVGPEIGDPAALGPAMIAKRINKFLNADGREMAEAVFSPPERQMLQAYADLHRKLVVPQAGAQWSNNAPILQKMLDKVDGGVRTAITTVVGHVIGLPLGAAEAVGYGVGKGTGAIKNAAQARKIAAQMPLVADQVAKWQKAVIASNKANTPVTNTMARIASVNLARSLEKLGVNPFGSTPMHVMQNLQGTLPAGAQQNQTQ